eukprot:5168370-Amphidinium_carterae.1
MRTACEVCDKRGHQACVAQIHNAQARRVSACSEQTKYLLPSTHTHVNSKQVEISAARKRSAANSIECHSTNSPFVEQECAGALLVAVTVKHT